MAIYISLLQYSWNFTDIKVKPNFNQQLRRQVRVIIWVFFQRPHMWNKLLCILHTRRHGVMWLNSLWWLLHYRYHKYLIEIAKTFGGVLLVRSICPGKDFELILTVKMETRHPIGGLFSREFLAFVIVAELWWPEIARPGIFLAILHFLEKRPLMVKFSKLCSQSLHGDTDRRCCVNVS